MTSLSSVSSPIPPNKPHLPSSSSSSQPASTSTTTNATASTDGTWELIVYISDLNLTKRLRVRGDLHVGGLMLKIVEGLENSRDWADCVIWWPKKNSWLHRTRSTLDQYGVQAGAVLHFLSTHGDLFLQLPDLQVIQVKADFSADVFSVVVKICKDLGIRHPEELSLSFPLDVDDLKKNRGISATRRGILSYGRTGQPTRSSVLDGRHDSRDSLGSIPPGSRRNSSQSLFMPNGDSSGSLLRFSLRRKKRLQSSLSRTCSTPISPPFYGSTLARTSSTSTSTSVTSPGSVNSVFSGLGQGHDLCHSPWVSSREALTLLNRPKGLTEKARCNAGWLDSSRSLMEQGVLPNSHLLLKFKFFTFFDLNPRLDAVRINQLYEQARWLILTEEVECTKEEMIVFASLQLHIQQLSRANFQLETASTTTATTRNDNDYDSCQTAEDLIDAALNDLQQALEGAPTSAALSSETNRASDAIRSSNYVPNRTSSDLFRLNKNSNPSSASHHFSKGIFFDDPVISYNPDPNFTSNGTYSNIPLDRTERQRTSTSSFVRGGSSGDNDYDSLIIRKHSDYDGLDVCSKLRPNNERAFWGSRGTSPSHEDSVFCGSADVGSTRPPIMQDIAKAPQLDGYLRFYKPRKFFLKSYKRHYFLFKDLTLSMFKSSNDNVSHQLIWSLNLKGCEVRSDILVPASKFIIKLVIPSIRGVDEIWFKMDTEQQYINWLAGLKLACYGRTMSDYSSFLDEIRNIQGRLAVLRGEENKHSNAGPSKINEIRRSVDDKENQCSKTLARGDSKRRSFFGSMRLSKNRNSTNTNTDITATLPEKPMERDDSILRHKANGNSRVTVDSLDEGLGSRGGSRFSSLISISKSVNSSSWKGSLNGNIQARDFLAPRFCRKSRLKRLMLKIAEAQEKLKDMSSIEAKLSFIKAWQSLPDFGYSYFVIKLKGSKKEDYFALTPTKIVLLDGSTEEVLQHWRFQNIKSWSINWEVKEVLVEFEDEDLAFQCYTADCKVVHEFIGGYIFLSMRCLERNQKLNHELFHKLTGGWS